MTWLYEALAKIVSNSERLATGWSEEQYAKLWDLFPNFLWNYSYIQIWKYFHSMVLGNVGSGYCKKKGVRVFSENLCLGRLSGSFCVSS